MFGDVFFHAGDALLMPPTFRQVLYIVMPYIVMLYFANLYIYIYICVCVYVLVPHTIQNTHTHLTH